MADSIAFRGFRHSKFAQMRAQIVVEPAPTISSVNYDQIDVGGGGQSIVITGSGFLGVSGGGGVKFGGTNATSYVVDSDTQITAVAPAHAAGTTSLLVTHPINGNSNSFTIEFWNLAVISATGNWRGSYSGSPWSGTVGGNLTEGTNPPSVGAAVGSYDPAEFNGTNNLLSTATVMNGNYVTDAAGTLAVLFFANSASANVAYYSNPFLIGNGTDGYLALTFSDSGVRLGSYDTTSGLFDSVAATCSTGAWHLAVGRWSTVAGLGVSVDDGAEQTLSKLVEVSLSAAGMNVGVNYTGASVFFDGLMLEIVTLNSRITDNDITKLRKYCNQRYGVSV